MSAALDVLEAELQRPADSEGTSCTVARMVCSELPPLSSCTGTCAGKCHGNRLGNGNGNYDSHQGHGIGLGNDTVMTDDTVKDLVMVGDAATSCSSNRNSC